MNEIVELSATLIQIFLLTWFISNFFGYKYTGARAKIGFLCCYAVVIAETMFINKIVVYDSFYAGIVVATLFLYARLCLDGKALFQIFISLFSMTIIFCVGSVTIFFISAVSAVGSEQLISDFSGWRIAVIAISKLAEFGAFWAIIHIKNDYSLSNKEWILFISMPFFYLDFRHAADQGDHRIARDNPLCAVHCAHGRVDKHNYILFHAADKSGYQGKDGACISAYAI